LVTGLLVLVGCQDESSGPSTQDFAQARAEAAARKKAKPPAKSARVARATEAKAGELGGFGSVDREFRYVANDRRDPFRSFEWERPDRITDADLRGPLEQFDVNQLSLVAVVWQTGNARALVQDPSGTSYIVAEGTRIGKNEGRVIRIDDSTVLVKERYVDYLGQETTKDIEIRMRQSQGG
jgi:Tfp pilus assembly protein PilP